MNTSGVIRGYMSKNMNSEEFIKVVIKAISREFEEKVILEQTNNGFEIVMKEYRITMSNELVDRLKSPYGIDKFILEDFEKQGFVFNRNRSQYIQYCFGNYVGAKY